ncbi:MAG: hypothetical protein ACE5HQ_10125 [Gemmatimonadota bacterium]
MTHRTDTTGSRNALVVGCAALLLGGGLAPARGGAQEREQEPIPALAAGTPVVVMPVQSVQPLPSGAWPAGARSMSDALDMLNAELSFAFGEERGAEGWAMPSKVVERAQRNPMLGIDPRRLAFRGLLAKPDKRARIYEPLHSQLRKTAALFGARLVVLPLAVWFEPDTLAPRGPAPPEKAGAGGRRSGRGEGEIAGREGGARGRAVLLLALVDVRRSAVLWHGRIKGGAVDLTSPSLFTVLAFRVARDLAPS